MSRTMSMRLCMGDIEGDEFTEGIVREQLVPFESAAMTPARPDKPLRSQNEEDRVHAQLIHPNLPNRHFDALCVAPP